MMASYHIIYQLKQNKTNQKYTTHIWVEFFPFQKKKLNFNLFNRMVHMSMYIQDNKSMDGKPGAVCIRRLMSTRVVQFEVGGEFCGVSAGACDM